VKAPSNAVTESLENFYYKAIYQVLQTPANYAHKANELKRLKAKIIRLHSAQRHGILLDNGETERMLGEDLSIHHFIQAIRRKKARSIAHIYDKEGSLHTILADIRRRFAAHMRQKYDHIPIDQACIGRMVECGMKKIPSEAHAPLEEPIDMDELLREIKKGKPNKVPGQDGISLDFFKKTIDLTQRDLLTIMNNMYIEGEITVNQKYGIIICIPKTTHPTTIEEYRPLTLLNTDYNC